MVNGHGEIPIVVKIEDWPSQDREAWEALFTPGSFFDEGGACEHWSDGTRRMRRQFYGQWLSFILRTCPDLAPAEPGARITQARVAAFIEESKARLKLRSVSNLVLSLAALAQAVNPEEDWAWLWRAASRLYKQSDPYRLKPRLPVRASDLYRWSLNRLPQVEQDPGITDRNQAMRFRQALMVGLLITRPVRARAFSNMRIGRHLEIYPSRYRLHFYKEDMKDDRERIYPFPEELVEPMRRYLAHYRPILLGETESDALWISRKGNPLSQDSFTSSLARLTRRHFGLALRPHAFRHIAATSIAEVDPAHVGIIADILGHATLNTSERHYNRAGMITASRKMQALIQDIRREGRRNARRGRRRPEL